MPLLEKGAAKSPFAQFVLRIRQLPFGVPAITALARLSKGDLQTAEYLRLASTSNRHRNTGYGVIAPNIFADLPFEAHSQFLRAGRDPKYLRRLLRYEIGYLPKRRFNLRSLARLIESVAHDYHSPTLLRIYNFRRPDARWPVKISTAPDIGWIAETNPDDPQPRVSQTRRKTTFRYTNYLIRLFRRWTRSAHLSGATFNFSQFIRALPRNVDADDRQACAVIEEVVRHQRQTGKPHSLVSLSRYLRDLPRLLRAERAGGSFKAGGPMRQLYRLVKAARARLGMHCVPRSSKLFSGVPPRRLELNLVPFARLEHDLLGTEAPPLDDLPAATSYVVLAIDVWTGRRSSDFALVRVRDLLEEEAAVDLTLPATKTRSAKNVRLPLHRLLPERILTYVRQWRVNIVTAFRGDATLYEIITGYPPPHGLDKDAVRSGLIAAFKRIFGIDHTRYHQARYAFASWAPVAIALSREPELLNEPFLAPWLEGSEFFSEQQLANWRSLVGSISGDSFALIASILSHVSAHELETDYCIAWPMLARINAAFAARAQEKAKRLSRCRR
jgi:hypothetical protein